MALLVACGEAPVSAPADPRLPSDGSRASVTAESPAPTAPRSVTDDPRRPEFRAATWLRGWLNGDLTVLTIRFGTTTCYRVEHRASAVDVGGQVEVQLETRRLEEPPVTCLANAVYAELDVVLPRPTRPDEIVDATCYPPAPGPAPVTSRAPATTAPTDTPPTEPTTEPTTGPADCHLRPVQIGPDPPASASTLPPLDG